MNNNLRNQRTSRHLIRSVTAKVTQEEYDILKLLASKNGNLTMSEYNRHVLLSTIAISPEARLGMMVSAIHSEMTLQAVKYAQSGAELTDDACQEIYRNAVSSAPARLEKTLFLLRTEKDTA